MLLVLRRLLQPDPEGARWGSLRRPPRHHDDALTGTTRAWLRRLPRRSRPLCLCERYPRVANRIAWHWHDAAASAEVLQDLLADRRGGRRGFPRAVQAELRRLKDLHDAGASQGATALALQPR